MFPSDCLRMILFPVHVRWADSVWPIGDLCSGGRFGDSGGYREELWIVKWKMRGGEIKAFVRI